MPLGQDKTLEFLIPFIPIDAVMSLAIAFISIARNTVLGQLSIFEIFYFCDFKEITRYLQNIRNFYSVSEMDCLYGTVVRHATIKSI